MIVIIQSFFKNNLPKLSCVISKTKIIENSSLDTYVVHCTMTVDRNDR